MTETLTNYKPNANQQVIIDDIVALQLELHKSDGDFARDHLQYSGSAWNRIKSLRYFEGLKDPDSIFLELTDDLRKLRRELALAKKVGGYEFLELQDFQNVFKAVETCKYKKDANRLILYKAESGGGKSVLCEQLALKHNAYVVEARPVWKKSYFWTLRDLAGAVGVKTDNNFNPQMIEEDMLHILQQHKTVIAIDEGEYFGPDALNIIKMILNKTPTVMVVCCIPEAYRRWTKHAHEAAQIIRRTHVVIEQKEITPSDALQFLKKLELEDDGKSSAVELSRAANEFGRYDFISRTMKLLTKCNKVSLTETQTAIKNVRRKMGLMQGKG